MAGAEESKLDVDRWTLPREASEGKKLLERLRMFHLLDRLVIHSGPVE